MKVPGGTDDKNAREPAKRALVIGECLIDLAPALPPRQPAPMANVEDRALRFTALPGGSPANVAIGLARLHVPASFGGRISRLAFGPVLREHLSRNGVDLSLAQDASEPPTLAVVTLDARGRASYTFYGPESADWQWSESALPFAKATPGSRTGRDLDIGLVHTGSLLTVFEPAATVITAWLRRVRAQGDVVVSFDPNVRPALVRDRDAFRLRMEDLVSNSHIVKASTEDMIGIYFGDGEVPEGAEDLGSSFVHATVATWLRLGAELILVTGGEQGAAAYHRRGWQAEEAPPQVEVKDTIGAGDAVTSAFLGYLYAQQLLTPEGVRDLGQEHVREGLHRSVAASAFTCSRAGADPPSLPELEAFLAQLSPGR